VIREGVVVHVRAVTEIAPRQSFGQHHVTCAEVSALALVPSSDQLSARLRWGRRLRPRLGDVWELPVVRKDDQVILRSNTERVLSITGLDDALSRMLQAVDCYALGSDGAKVLCRVGGTVTRDGLEAAVDTVASIARFDDGLAATLYGLPDAQPLRDHELHPGVGFAEDGLVLGVHDRARMVAQLDNFPASPTKAAVRDGVVTADDLDVTTAELLLAAGDGDLHVTSKAARYTWTHVQRDRERLLAGVKALRSLRPVDGPYR